jgi:putative FmdB family regulatory protein
MPIYEYRCEKGHEFEVMQRISEDPLSVCEVCEAPVRKVFTPVAVHFKGSGFYNTDYGTRKRAREMSESKEGKSDSASKDKSSDGKTSDSGSSDSKSGKEPKGSKSDGATKKTEAKAA